MEQTNNYVPSKICWAHIDYGDENCRVSAENRFCSQSNPGDYECQLNCPTYSRCKHTYEIGNFPNKFWDIPDKIITPSEDYAAVVTLSAIRRDIFGFINTGQNILLHSDTTGTGKTFQACLLAQSYIFRQSNASYHSGLAYYVYLPSWVSKYDIYDKFMKDDERRNVFFNNMNDLHTADLVVWDGLGFNSGSRVENVIMRSIIQSRLNERRSNIFIPYGDMLEFDKFITKFDLSRIRDNSIDIELNGSSFSAKETQDYLYGVNDAISSLSKER